MERSPSTIQFPKELKTEPFHKKKEEFSLF